MIAGAGPIMDGVRARQKLLLPVAVVVVTALLVFLGLTTAQHGSAGRAALTNGVIGAIALFLILDHYAVALAQRVLRSIVGLSIAAVLAFAAASVGSPTGYFVGGLAVVAAAITARQWFSNTAAPAVRAAFTVTASAAVVLGITLALVVGITAQPWATATALIAGGVDIALAVLYLADRTTDAGREFSLRVVAGLVAMVAGTSAAIDLIAYSSSSWQVPDVWRGIILTLVVTGIVVVMLLMLAAWRHSAALRRAAAAVVVVGLNVALLSALTVQSEGAVLPLILGVVFGDLAFLARAASQWMSEESRLKEPLSLLGTFFLVVAADMAMLWAAEYLPDAGVQAAHKLLWAGDVGALIMVVSRWLPTRLAYFLRRMVLGAITVLLITFAVFYLVTLLPDQWWKPIVNAKNNTPERKLLLIHQLGFDRPIFVQYLLWLNGVLQWPPDLGMSGNLHQSVIDAILGPSGKPWFETRVGATVILLGASYVLQLLIAIPVGIISAIKPYSKTDNFVTAGSFIGISLPNYWFGALLIFFFAIEPFQSHGSVIFPAGGEFTDPYQPNVLDLLWHLVLPTIVLAVQGIASYARFVRSSMLDVLSQDFIRTARAKGLSPMRVTIRHAFRNSLLPLITLIGIDLPQIFVGAIITEFVFNWPGMGQFSVTEVQNADVIPVIGIILILSALVVIGSLIADLSYTVADPRIKYDEA